MSEKPAQHSTIILGRTYEAPVAEVFAAIIDPEDRGRIFSGSEKLTVTFEQADLRVNGRDVFRFGRGDETALRGEAVYHDVVDERRIVYSDVISHAGACVWVAAVTIEFVAQGARTQVKVTAQTVLLDDVDGLEGVSGRFAAFLDNLQRHLDGTLRFRPRTVSAD